MDADVPRVPSVEADGRWAHQESWAVVVLRALQAEGDREGEGGVSALIFDAYIVPLIMAVGMLLMALAEGRKR